MTEFPHKIKDGNESLVYPTYLTKKIFVLDDSILTMHFGEKDTIYLSRLSGKSLTRITLSNKSLDHSLLEPVYEHNDYMLCPKSILDNVDLSNHIVYEINLNPDDSSIKSFSILISIDIFLRFGNNIKELKDPTIEFTLLFNSVIDDGPVIVLMTVDEITDVFNLTNSKPLTCIRVENSKSTTIYINNATPLGEFFKTYARTITDDIINDGGHSIHVMTYELYYLLIDHIDDYSRLDFPTIKYSGVLVEGVQTTQDNIIEMVRFKTSSLKTDLLYQATMFNSSHVNGIGLNRDALDWISQHRNSIVLVVDGPPHVDIKKMKKDPRFGFTYMQIFECDTVEDFNILESQLSKASLSVIYTTTEEVRNRIHSRISAIEVKHVVSESITVLINNLHRHYQKSADSLKQIRL